MDHPTPKSTPRDVFYYLLAIVTLFVSVINFITLLFQYINVMIPDQVDFYFTGASDAIRVATAALFVVWPVYCLMSWLLGKDMRTEPAKREIKIRKWLLYFTLFIAAITIIVDLIILIYNFMGGELTARFGLKILTVLIVAGVVFGYYIWDIRRTTGSISTAPKTMAWIISVVILIGISVSFFVIGSPTTQRSRRFDEQRINNLQMIQGEVLNFWINKRALPENIGALKNDISGFIPPVDPQTLEPYEYNIQKNKTQPTFDVCAVFALPNEQTSASKSRMPYVTPVGANDPYNQNWTHTAGRVCFTRTIDPELYPKPVK